MVVALPLRVVNASLQLSEKKIRFGLGRGARFPEPRHPRSAASNPASTRPTSPKPIAAKPAAARARSTPHPQRTSTRSSAVAAHHTEDSQPMISPDDPQGNLAVRVRRPIADRLTDMVYQLRRQGIRTSKAEMIELLVWQYVPDHPTEDSRRFWRHSGSWRRERAWPDFVPGPQA